MSQNNQTFYFCDLKTKDIKCPHADRCKRWVYLKDIPYEMYKEVGVAQLHNICKDTNYSMFMEVVHE